VIRGGPLDDSTLIARHIGNAEMVTCATPGYLKNHGVPAYPQELCNGHKLTSRPSPGGRFLSLQAAWRGDGNQYPHYLGINESNAHLAAAVAGLGIVQTFEYSAKPYLQAGTLARSWATGALPRIRFTWYTRRTAI
jgi:DNA-binding transcriptional LysR family regulator